MYCSKCGKELKPNQKFCPNCWNKVREKDTNIQMQINENVDAGRSNLENNLGKAGTNDKGKLITIIKSISKKILLFTVLILITMASGELIKRHLFNDSNSAKKETIKEEVSLGEKIKKAEENIVWTDKKYDKYFNLNKSAVGVYYSDGFIYSYGIVDNTLMTDLTGRNYENMGDFEKRIYDETFLSQNLELVFADNKYGYIDKTGNEVIPLSYTVGFNFSQGLATVLKNGMMAVIDETEKEVVEPKYDYISEFFGDLATVKYDGKYGFIDKSGREIVRPQYDLVGYVDERTNPRLNYSYSRIPDFWDDMVLVMSDGKIGYLDSYGNEVIRPIYDSGLDFSEGLAAVSIGAKYGFIDKSGRLVIEAKYDDAKYFSGGLAKVGLDGKWGYINKEGKEIVDIKYDEVGYGENKSLYTEDLDGFHINPNFKNELSRVKLDGKWGYVDISGREVVEPKYDNAYSFSDGLAAVETNGKWGYVDTTGKEVIEPKYDVAYSFSDELAAVNLDGKWGYINKDGVSVGDIKYDEVGYEEFRKYIYDNYYAEDAQEGSVSEFSNSFTRVKLDGKYGIIDKDGKEIIEPKYDSISKFRNNTLIVVQGDKVGALKVE